MESCRRKLNHLMVNLLFLRQKGSAHVSCALERSIKTKFQLIIYCLLPTLTAWCPVHVKSALKRRTNQVRLTVRYKTEDAKFHYLRGCQFRPGPYDARTRPLGPLKPDVMPQPQRVCQPTKIYTVLSHKNFT